MVNLDCWLPEKEMFGRFSVETICAKREQLEVVVSNEVFRFTIHFPGGVSTYCVMTAKQAQGRLATLRADHEVYMRGNTFSSSAAAPCRSRIQPAGGIHTI